MKSLFRILYFLILSYATSMYAQTATFEFKGSFANSIFTTIDNVPASPTYGWNGSLNVIAGNWLNLLDVPQAICSTTGLFTDPCLDITNPDGTVIPGFTFPDFPNNGFLGCVSGCTIVWGNKIWGIRTDGSTMDGTQNGDTYTLTGNTGTFDEWNGSVTVSLTQNHLYIPTKKCIIPTRSGCFRFILIPGDSMTGGSGTVSCVGLGTYGACQGE